MMFYIAILSLGLLFLYTLRDAVLTLQRERDAKRLQKPLPADDINIIIQNEKKCKRAG